MLHLFYEREHYCTHCVDSIAYICVIDRHCTLYFHVDEDKNIPWRHSTFLLAHLPCALSHGTAPWVLYTCTSEHPSAALPSCVYCVCVCLSVLLRCFACMSMCGCTPETCPLSLVDAVAHPLPRPRVRARPLTMARQVGLVAQAAVTPDILEPLDV